MTFSTATTGRPQDPANWLGRVLVLSWLVIATAVLVSGLDYYRADPAARAYSAARELYAPTGRIGQSLGYLGSLFIIVGVVSYSLRKRWRRLERVGRLSAWLQVHIFLCTMGPYLVLVHTSFKFNGVAAIAFWSMVAAVLSGMVGRYLYAHIPRTIGGSLRTLNALQLEAEEAQRSLGDVAPAARAALEPVFATATIPPRSLPRAVAYAVSSDFRRRAQVRRAKRLVRPLGLGRAERERLLGLVRARLRLEQQVALLAPFQRLFHYWHVVHLPVAILMFLMLALHVGLVVAFGYAWPF